MNVFNWSVTQDLIGYLCSATLQHTKKVSYLHCKGFAPLRIEGFVDCVSVKPAVTKLHNT